MICDTMMGLLISSVRIHGRAIIPPSVKLYWTPRTAVPRTATDLYLYL